MGDEKLARRAALKEETLTVMLDLDRSLFPSDIPKPKPVLAPASPLSLSYNEAQVTLNS